MSDRGARREMGGGTPFLRLVGSEKRKGTARHLTGVSLSLFSIMSDVE